jgi:hypothetical protein
VRKIQNLPTPRRGAGARLASMVNTSELLINVVNVDPPKALLEVWSRSSRSFVGLRDQDGSRRIGRT